MRDDDGELEEVRLECASFSAFIALLGADGALSLHQRGVLFPASGADMAVLCIYVLVALRSL